MGLDTGSQQIVVGINKDDIFARTRRETFLRREALTAGIFPPQYFRVRILSRNIEKNTGAAIGRSVVDDDALYVRVGLFKNGLGSLSSRLLTSSEFPPTGTTRRNDRSLPGI